MAKAPNIIVGHPPKDDAELVVNGVVTITGYPTFANPNPAGYSEGGYFYFDALGGSVWHPGPVPTGAVVGHGVAGSPDALIIGGGVNVYTFGDVTHNTLEFGTGVKDRTFSFLELAEEQPVGAPIGNFFKAQDRSPALTTPRDSSGAGRLTVTGTPFVVNPFMLTTRHGGLVVVSRMGGHTFHGVTLDLPAPARPKPKPPAPAPQVLSVVRVGGTAYRLRHAARWTYSPAMNGGELGRFEVAGLEGVVVGRGPTADAARRDWETRFHVLFQELYVLQDDERTPAQHAAWELLSRLLDVEAYRKRDSIVGREVGKVVRTRPGGKVIRWAGGGKELVRYARAPGGLAGAADGSWVEALVARHPDTYRIRRVLWLAPHTPRTGVLDAARRAKIDRIPTTATLPKTTWD